MFFKVASEDGFLDFWLSSIYLKNDQIGQLVQEDYFSLDFQIHET